MCGRYDLNESTQMMMLYFHLTEIIEGYSNSDIRPTNRAPIIRTEAEQRVARLARWGLIPGWAKDDAIAQHTFNARGETVAEKPSFRAAFKRRRCLVPASAFFEWQAVPGQKKKRKLRIAGADGQPLALAGLWETWTPPGAGEAIESYTVITTAANAAMQPIHDRMPVILGPGDWDGWLDPTMNNPVFLQSLLVPCPDEWLEIAEA